MVTNVQNMISFPKCFNAYTSTLITASFIEALNQNHRVWYFLKNQETVQLKWLTVSKSYSYNFDYTKKYWDKQIQRACDSFSSLYLYLSIFTSLSISTFISLPFYLFQGGHATPCGISVTSESPAEKHDWPDTLCCILPLLPWWHHQTYRAPVQELCLEENVLS